MKIFNFVNKIDFSDSGCWLWISSINGSGYGMFYADGKMKKAHRVSYEWFVGPIPNDLVLDHLCRVRNCVNPDHLEPVTQKENTLRGTSVSALNAVKTHCPQGHEYTEENTRIKQNGSRDCKVCNRERKKTKEYRLYLSRYRNTDTYKEKNKIKARERYLTEEYRKKNRERMRDFRKKKKAGAE